MLVLEASINPTEFQSVLFSGKKFFTLKFCTNVFSAQKFIEYDEELLADLSHLKAANVTLNIHIYFIKSTSTALLSVFMCQILITILSIFKFWATSTYVNTLAQSITPSCTGEFVLR